jgi:hypothetical protein
MKVLAVVGVEAALLRAACSSAGGRDAHAADQGSSCVDPFIRSDKERRPPALGSPTTLGRVSPGQQVTVFGWWYYAGPCTDVADGGASPPSARSGASVPIRLTTCDGVTRVVATAKPAGAEARFAATFVVPSDAAAGPARVSDGRGHFVTLTITPG